MTPEPAVVADRTRFRAVSARREDLLNAIFPAEGFDALDVLDLHPFLGRQLFSAGASDISEWQRELFGVIENADAPAVKLGCHACGYATLGRMPGAPVDQSRTGRRQSSARDPRSGLPSADDTADLPNLLALLGFGYAEVGKMLAVSLLTSRTVASIPRHDQKESANPVQGHARRLKA